MVLKSQDDIAPQLMQLEELLKLRLSARQVALVKEEIAIVKAGFRAESKAAFEIDFRLKSHKDWVIIHDLRIEHKGRVAQIDHLLFFPTWEFYVVETKGIKTKVRIEDGQWSFVQNNHWRGMANPVEQNARHIDVLRELVRDLDMIPRTMGLKVSPRFVNVVVVPPDCLIQQEKRQSWVVHMDRFVTKARRDFNLGNAVRNLIQIHSGKDARSVGEKLIALHRPFQIDYRKRFGIISKPGKIEDEKPRTERHRCASCGGPVTDAEAGFCRINAVRFANQLLCRKCQAYAPAQIKASAPKPKALPPSAKPVGGSHCAACGKKVNSSVVSFCRANKAQLGGRVLCTNCQLGVRQKRRTGEGMKVG